MFRPPGETFHGGARSKGREEVTMPPALIGLFVPIVFFLCAAVVAIAAMSFRQSRRELIHRERLALIEKGAEIPPALLVDTAAPTAASCLLRGLIYVLVGVALAIFFVAMALAEGDKEMYAVATAGLIPVGVGIAYLVCYRKMKTEAN